MNSESPFWSPRDESPVEFYRQTASTYQSVEYGVDVDSKATLEDAAAAIAGVLHLYEKPGEDVHGYTDYLPEARAFLLSREITANPDSGPDFERVYDDAPAKRDPLAALGIE